MATGLRSRTASASRSKTVVSSSITGRLPAVKSVICSSASRRRPSARGSTGATLAAALSAAATGVVTKPVASQFRELCGTLIPVLTRPPIHDECAVARELTLDEIADGGASAGDGDLPRVEPGELGAHGGRESSVRRHKKEWVVECGGNRPGSKCVRKVGARCDRDSERVSRVLRLEGRLRDGDGRAVPVSAADARVSDKDQVNRDLRQRSGAVAQFAVGVFAPALDRTIRGNGTGMPAAAGDRDHPRTEPDDVNRDPDSAGRFELTRSWPRTGF